MSIQEDIVSGSSDSQESDEVMLHSWDAHRWAVRFAAQHSRPCALQGMSVRVTFRLCVSL